jgi:hypothetical protein
MGGTGNFHGRNREFLNANREFFAGTGNSPAASMELDLACPIPAASRSRNLPIVLPFECPAELVA